MQSAEHSDDRSVRQRSSGSAPTIDRSAPSRAFSMRRRAHRNDGRGVHLHFIAVSLCTFQPLRPASRPAVIVDTSRLESSRDDTRHGEAPRSSTNGMHSCRLEREGAGGRGRAVQYVTGRTIFQGPSSSAHQWRPPCLNLHPTSVRLQIARLAALARTSQSASAHPSAQVQGESLCALCALCGAVTSSDRKGTWTRTRICGWPVLPALLARGQLHPRSSSAGRQRWDATPPCINHPGPSPASMAMTSGKGAKT